MALKETAGDKKGGLQGVLHKVREARRWCWAKKGERPNIPVLMYHSVGVDDTNWIQSFLSVPVHLFERHLRYLRKAGWETILLDDLIRHMRDGEAVPRRSVVITFDDGYLDNWVYAVPLLRKYGYRATLFLNPDFVDPREDLRPTLSEVWRGEVALGELERLGYMSWAEMRAAEALGVLDVQSHAMTHTWYFCGGKIVDFHRPGDPYFWLAWNARPERKFAWMREDQSEFVPWGTPVYQFGKSLEVRRFFPDDRPVQHLVEFVKRNGGRGFFERAGWRKVLQEEHDRIRATLTDLADRYETQDEYLARVRWELGESKRLIETNLGKEVSYLCWPGGGYNDEIESIAFSLGYRATTIRGEPNRYGKSNWRRIDRTSLRHHFESRLMRKIARTECYFWSQLLRYRELPCAVWLNRVLRAPHAWTMLRQGGRPRTIFDSGGHIRG